MSKRLEKPSEEQKKAYHTPTLRTFGTVQQITQANVMTLGMTDNVMERKTGIAGVN